MLDPAHEASRIVNDVLFNGSNEDGRASVWRSKSQMYHLTKAMGHLATHIKYKTCGGGDGDNHLHLALTRIAMALCV